MTNIIIENIGTMPEVKIYPMAMACQEAGYCLGLSTGCNLYPIGPGFCRERFEAIKIDPCIQHEVEQEGNFYNNEEYWDDKSA